MKNNIEARYAEGVYERVVGDFPVRHMNQVQSEDDLVCYKAYRKFVHARWYAKNRDTFLSKNREKSREDAKARYQSLSAAERRAEYEQRYAARKAKLKADVEFASDQALKQHERFVRWNEAHPGLHAERGAEWAKAHPEYRRSIEHARRALGKIDRDFVKFLRSQSCIDCGKPPSQNCNGVSDIGHLVPIKRGGTNHPCNLVAQCRSCNSKQHAKVHPKFAQVNYPEAARYAVAA